MKNIKLQFLVFVIIIALLTTSIAIMPSKNVKALEKNNKEIYIDAKAAIAIDSKSKMVLFEKNSNMLVPIASTTKIVTALVAFSYGNLDKRVQISEKAAKIRGSTVGYREGEIISLRELIYGLMLRSGNDAAIAIAEGVAGSVDNFVKLMNEYALQIGLTNTHFDCPHGLDSDTHYSTAYDLAMATIKAKNIEEFNKLVSLKSVKKEEYNFTRSYNNINKILWQIEDANGVKTGYTGKAGKCLVSSIFMGKSDVIIVVLNCTPRWKETNKIYKYVKENYTFQQVAKKGECLGEVKIENKNKKIKLISNNDIYIPEKNGEQYKIKIIKPKCIKAPIKKGQKVGSIQIFNENKLIFNRELYSNETVNKTYKLIKLFEK